MIHWKTGLANVVEVKGKYVTVLCPHCGNHHQHGRAALGSRHVVAGCHAGPTLLREYRIPDRAAKPRGANLKPRGGSANDLAEANQQVSNAQRAPETSTPANQRCGASS